MQQYVAPAPYPVAPQSPALSQYPPAIHPAPYGYNKVEPMKITIPTVEKCDFNLKKLLATFKKALLLKKVLLTLGKKKFPPVVPIPIPIPVGCVPIKKKPKDKNKKNKQKKNKGKKKLFDDFMDRLGDEDEEDDDDLRDGATISSTVNRLSCPPGTVPIVPPVDPPAGPPTPPSSTTPSPPTTPSTTTTTYRPYWPPPIHAVMPLSQYMYSVPVYAPPEREPGYAHPTVAYPDQPLA